MRKNFIPLKKYPDLCTYRWCDSRVSKETAPSQDAVRRFLYVLGAGLDQQKTRHSAAMPVCDQLNIGIQNPRISRALIKRSKRS